MAELVRHHPLEPWVPAFAGLPAAVGISVEPYVPMVNVRSEPPAEPNTWVEFEGGRAIWLGPDEWLLTGVDAQVLAVPAGGSVVDQSAQRIQLRLSGSRIREVLGKGCSIDLHPRAFTPGRCAQTTLGQAAVVLLALDEGFAVLVRSSFAGYLADWLLDASLEYV